MNNTQVLDSLVSQETHTTEPYMTVGAAYNNLSRKSAFALSCLTSAVQDQYFTKKIIISNSNNNNNNNNFYPFGSLYNYNNSKNDTRNRVVWIVVSVIVAALLLFSIAFIVIMWRQEKKGEPIFRQSLLDHQSHSNNSNNLNHNGNDSHSNMKFNMNERNML